MFVSHDVTVIRLVYISPRLLGSSCQKFSNKYLLVLFSDITLTIIETAPSNLAEVSTRVAFMKEELFLLGLIPPLERLEVLFHFVKIRSISLLKSNLTTQGFFFRVNEL